jgi:hypothetical protein
MENIKAKKLAKEFIFIKLMQKHCVVGRLRFLMGRCMFCIIRNWELGIMSYELKNNIISYDTTMMWLGGGNDADYRVYFDSLHYSNVGASDKVIIIMRFQPK